MYTTPAANINLDFVWRIDAKLEAEEANRSGYAHGLQATWEVA